MEACLDNRLCNGVIDYTTMFINLHNGRLGQTVNLRLREQIPLDSRSGSIGTTRSVT